LSPPSPAGVISIIALFVALGGTGYAASTIVSPSARTAARKVTKSFVKRQARVTADAEIVAKAPTLTVGNATNAVTAQTANNANNLGGQPASAFAPSSKIQRFNVKVGFGTTTTLFTAGVLTFSLKCEQNGTDPKGTAQESYAALEVSTSQDGAVLATQGESSASGNGASSTFLNQGTPESGRLLAINTRPAGGKGYAIDIDGGSVLGPDGSAVSLPVEGVGLGVNLFGVGCTANGFAVIDS
jgi:hypothetical protein